MWVAVLGQPNKTGYGSNLERKNMFVISRPDGYCWSKRDYWTLFESNFKAFKTEKSAMNYMVKNGMAERLKMNRKMDVKVRKI